MLSATSFSTSITHILCHPPVLLTHLASAYLTQPHPLSNPEKYWGVFIPFSERAYESEKLVFGPNGDGGGGTVKGELVVEILVRAGGEGRRRAVERVLEGWADAKGGPCELSAMESLKSIWHKKFVTEEVGHSVTSKPVLILAFFRLPQILLKIFLSTSTSLNHSSNLVQRSLCLMLMKVSWFFGVMLNTHKWPQGKWSRGKQHPLLFFTIRILQMTLMMTIQTRI